MHSYSWCWIIFKVHTWLSLHVLIHMHGSHLECCAGDAVCSEPGVCRCFYTYHMDGEYAIHDNFEEDMLYVCIFLL